MKNTTLALSLMAAVLVLASGSAIAEQPGRGDGTTVPIKIPSISRDGTMAPLDEQPLDEPPAPPDIRVSIDNGDLDTVIRLIKVFQSGASESQQQCCFTDCDTYQNRCVTVCGSC